MRAGPSAVTDELACITGGDVSCQRDAVAALHSVAHLVTERVETRGALPCARVALGAFAGAGPPGGWWAARDDCDPFGPCPDEDEAIGFSSAYQWCAHRGPGLRSG